MTGVEKWLRTRYLNLIVWNDDCTIDVDASLARVMDSDE